MVSINQPENRQEFFIPKRLTSHCELYFGSNRLIMPFRFRSIEKTLIKVTRPDILSFLNPIETI